MNETSITTFIIDTFANVEKTQNFGYTFFFYGADRKLPFATIASSDNVYDRISNLDRPEAFRLNIGVSKQTFRALFGPEKVDLTLHDFTAFDKIMPHPVYASQSFVCVLNPSDATFEHVRTLLAEAYELAVRRHTKNNRDTIQLPPGS